MEWTIFIWNIYLERDGNIWNEIELVSKIWKMECSRGVPIRNAPLHREDIAKENTPADLRKIQSSMLMERMYRSVAFSLDVLRRFSWHQSKLVWLARKQLLCAHGLTLKLSLAKNFPKKLTSVHPLFHLSWTSLNLNPIYRYTGYTVYTTCMAWYQWFQVQQSQPRAPASCDATSLIRMWLAGRFHLQTPGNKHIKHGIIIIIPRKASKTSLKMLEKYWSRQPDDQLKWWQPLNSTDHESSILIERGFILHSVTRLLLEASSTAPSRSGDVWSLGIV